MFVCWISIPQIHSRHGVCFARLWSSYTMEGRFSCLPIYITEQETFNSPAGCSDHILCTKSKLFLMYPVSHWDVMISSAITRTCCRHLYLYLQKNDAGIEKKKFCMIPNKKARKQPISLSHKE